MSHSNVRIMAFATMIITRMIIYHATAWTHAAISSCARHAHYKTSFHGRLRHRQSILRSSRALHASNPVDILANVPYPSLYDKTLVSVQECIDAARLQQTRLQQCDHTQPDPNLPRLHFVDASWYHRPDPVTNLFRNPSREFQSGPRLPHSHHLDIDALATTHELFPSRNPKKLPHMMPPPDLFALAMDAYGIRQDEAVSDHVVIYARRGAVFAPRTWFLFVSMGHDPKKVHWMQGSLEDWMEMGGKVEYDALVKDGVSCGEGYEDCFDGGILNVTRLYLTRGNDKTKFRYRTRVSQATNICEKDEVLQAVNEHLLSSTNLRNQTNNLPIDSVNGKTIIIDTRGSGYTEKGHMPSAIHLPYRQLVSSSNPLVLLPKQELHDLFASRGIPYQDPDAKIILSCGSGVSVCHAFLALTVLGRKITEENTRVYDGSWKEWGRVEEDLPRVLPGELG